MHIEYAAESFQRLSQPKHSPAGTDQQLIEVHAAQKEFIALAEASGDKKAADIAATIRKNAGNKYAKVTSAQRYALAAALLQKHGTAKAVYAAAFGVTVEAFDEVIASI